MEHHFEISWSIRCIRQSHWWGYWQVCSYHCFVYKHWFDASIGLIPAAAELMIPSKLHSIPCVEHAVQIIGVDLCLLVLRSREAMMLQWSHLMNAPGILWSTPSVHISGGRHLKARTLVWSHLFLLSGAVGVRWWHCWESVTLEACIIRISVGQTKLLMFAKRSHWPMVLLWSYDNEHEQ